MTTEDATAPKCPKCGLSATCELCRLYGPLQHPAPAPVEVDGEAMSEQVDVERLRHAANRCVLMGYGYFAVDIRAAAAEITALRERVADAERLRDVWMEKAHKWADQSDEIVSGWMRGHAEQITRAEAAEADAARYRWLRQWVTKPNDMPAMPEPETVEQFDAAIDAAMSERK
jgi:hypothetical protein